MKYSSGLSSSAPSPRRGNEPPRARRNVYTNEVKVPQPQKFLAKRSNHGNPAAAPPSSSDADPDRWTPDKARFDFLNLRGRTAAPHSIRAWRFTSGFKPFVPGMASFITAQAKPFIPQDLRYITCSRLHRNALSWCGRPSSGYRRCRRPMPHPCKGRRTDDLELLAFVAALMVANAGYGWAQETTGSIAGRVSDPQGLAVPGATVTVTGARGAQTFTADAEGRFNAPFLTPGTYTVRAELQGFKATEQKDVVVRLGQRVDLPITMAVGGLTETVEVTGGSPTIDTSTTTVGAVINSDLLQRVPIGRRFSDALYIAPGVTDSGAGAANPSVAGGSGLENQYVVDGVNITNTGYGALRLRTPSTTGRSAMASPTTS